MSQISIFVYFAHVAYTSAHVAYSKLNLGW